MARLASVIIASYNYGRFLGDAIESALAQTYAPVEVIVVDDGSTDESRNVIARVGDRVQSILKANGGQASAWNAGFAASAGDVVLFLDADDLYRPGADYDLWIAHSWWHRQAAAIGDLTRLPDAHRPMILADEGSWEVGPLAGRQRLPFLEAHGEYAGPPSDDAHAIAELARLQATGARFVAFAWPAFWWLDHYRGLRHYLQQFRQVVANERLAVFDLDVPTTPPAP
jgi:glycosyltransferase involved in cell wall biosynthesis